MAFLGSRIEFGVEVDRWKALKPKWVRGRVDSGMRMEIDLSDHSVMRCVRRVDPEAVPAELRPMPVNVGSAQGSRVDPVNCRGPGALCHAGPWMARR